MLKPVSLGCGHSGCKTCIEMLFQLDASGAAPKCALCRTTLTEKTGSLGINFALDNLTRDLPVQCMSSGCTWKGIYSDARSHHLVCAKLEVKCGNDGCHYKLRSRTDATACRHVYKERDPVSRLQEICDAGVNGPSPFISMFSCDDPLPSGLRDTIAKV